MHFVLQTASLQHLAGVKVVASLWNQRDVMSQIEHSKSLFDEGYSEQDVERWTAIEETVKSNAWALPLTQPCKKQLIPMITPLGIEINLYWRQYHTIGSKHFHPRQFCWTMHGTVDYKKTAVLMVRDGTLDIESRFEIASLNCLKDEALELFESMGEEREQKYMDSIEQNGMLRWQHRFLLLFFTGRVNYHQPTHLRGNLIYNSLFRYSLYYVDGGMCEYWFEKLSQREREQFFEARQIQRFSLKQSRASSLLFYLSRMNEDQQERMFAACIRDVLKCLLGWPLQSLFMEAAKCGWRFVDENIYSDVLDEITRLITRSSEDYDYYQLFWEFWRLSPAQYKKHFLNNTDRLERLLATKRKEFIPLVLKHSPSLQLKELVDNRFDKLSRALMDERVISEAALMECKEKAALRSSKDKENVEKRLRSENVDRIVDTVIERRIKRRKKV